MNKEELEELLTDCPTLYHMAEHNSWASIEEHGLLSTTALLDLYKVSGQRRAAIEAQRRPTNVSLTYASLPGAVIRDQAPMDDAGLRRCLPPGLAPSEWYRLLNTKVFFWMTRDRLERLLMAGLYRNKIHDVLELDARALTKNYRNKIWCCPMNSGCTKPIPHPRDMNTFLKIDDYPYAEWRKKRKKGERVVEFAVEYSVPDVKKYVVKVTQMQGKNILRTIYKA